MVMYLLERDREGGLHLSEKLKNAMEKVGHCRQCRNLTEEKLCEICGSRSRDGTTLCVVETPADVMAIEQSGSYRGTYFVLMGHLSPIDGIGPEELGLDQLMQRVGESVEDSVREVIIATNPTVEGEATAHYISEMLSSTGVEVSRIAHGIPLGGELEYVDGGTLTHALAGRIRISTDIKSG